ncbi:unnamed protein product [Calicophoron daubneyi]|uniref:Centrosomal protein of 290kDa coiled-coil region domain-containing protein n=1 Tax=Calicophoron daubneyi TaxID=300641 RepID=A0AAV2T696_CALDB
MYGDDWEKIKDVTESALTIENAEYYGDILGEMDVEGWENIKNIKHAFILAQFLLNIRSEQFRAAEEHNAELVSELLSVREQHSELERENVQLRKASASGKTLEFIDDRRSLTIESQRLEEECEKLRKNLSKVSCEREDLLKEKDELVVKINTLQEEQKGLAERCEVLQLRYQEKPALRELAEAKYRKDMSSLRAQLRTLRAEINSLEDDKHNMALDISRLEKSLKQATAEIDRAADEHLRIKEALADADKNLAEKSSECDLLRAQISQLSQKFDDSDGANDIIMSAVDNKVQEWKQILEGRNDELVRLYKEVSRLRRELHNSAVEADRNSIQALTKTVRDRDQQIQILKDQLTDATREVERSAALLSELRLEVRETGGGSEDRKMERIRLLRKEIEEKDGRILEIEKRCKLAEEAAQYHANEVNNLEKQLERYEKGEYGLAEAITELRATKAQLASKDRQIEELCRTASKAETAVNETNLENEHLRVRLGIPLDQPIDLNGYRKMKAASEEEERALNLVLQKEIEKLEDERLDLKRRLRGLARQLGQKVGAEEGVISNLFPEEDTRGINEEMFAVAQTSSLQALPPSKQRQKQTELTRTGELPTIWRSRIDALNSELVQSTETVEQQQRRFDELKTRLDQVTEANVCLEEGLRHLQAEMKLQNVAPVLDSSNSNTGQKIPQEKERVRAIECPSLDKLLAALDSRSLGEDLDTARFLKSRVDHLEGANSELRRELREVRLDAATSELQLKESAKKIQQLDSQVRALQMIGGPAGTDGEQALLLLPKDLTPDAEEMIHYLEAHLASALKDLEEKTKLNQELDRSVDAYRRQFDICRHKQGLLYGDFQAEREEWKEERKKMEEQLIRMEERLAEAEVHKSELARLTETLSQMDSSKGNQPGLEEVKNKLAELTREITVLRVNKNGLTRRYVASQETEGNLRKENTSLKSDLIQLESAVTARLGYYARYKESAAFQLENLQKALDDSVPRVDYERLMREHEELAGKYRECMDGNLNSAGSSVTLATAQSQMKKLQEQHEALKTQLSLEKERRCLLEAGATQKLNGEKAGYMGNMQTLDANSSMLAKKLALIEMKELNERERANHAQNLLETVKNLSQQLEERNKELEATVGNLTKSSLELQTSEQQLRQELAEAVPRSLHSEMEKQLQELEKTNLKLRHEIDQLKEVAVISVAQTQNFEDQQVRREVEAESLRQQLIELESKDDQNATLASLHRHLTRLQISESTAVRRLATAQSKNVQLEQTVLRLEQRVSEKELELGRQHSKMRQRAYHLRNAINVLRSRFAGCVSLSTQEKLTSKYTNAMKEQARLQTELDAAIDAKIEAESKLEGQEERNLLAEEIRKLLNDSNSSKNPRGSVHLALEKKISEWQSRLSDMRVSEAAHRRQSDRYRQQMEHLEKLVRNQEVQLGCLELENSRLAKELDQRELEWEHRENELEEELYSSKATQSEVIATATCLNTVQNASKVVRLYGETDQFPIPLNPDQCVPDPSLPITRQLEEAIKTIKRYVTALFDLRVENDGLKKRNTDLLNELRGREFQLAQAVLARPAIQLSPSSANLENNPTVASLKANMDLLQRRLEAKEESLVKAKNLLQQAYETSEQANEQHRKDIADLHKKLRGKMEETVIQLSQAVESAGQKNLSSGQTGDLSRRLRDLEDALAEQNQAVIRQVEQGKGLKQERDMWQNKYRELVSQSNAEKNTMEDDYRRKLSGLKRECDQLHADLDDRNEKLARMTAELEHWKVEATRSPSVMQRQLTDRLKADLAEKEKQYQAISKALAELRKDLVAQAEQAVLASTVPPVAAYCPEPVKRRKLATAPTSTEIIIQEEQPTAVEAPKNYSAPTSNRIKKMEEDNQRLEEECKELRGQLERLKQARTLGKDCVLKRQIDDLTRKNQSLEEENKRLRMVPEKPYQDTLRALKETAQAARSGANNNDWEARKRLMAEVDKLKKQLQSTDADRVYAQKQLELIRAALDRATRENELLRERVNDQWGPAALPDGSLDIESERIKHTKQAPLSAEDLCERVDLHQQVESLQSEVERLKRAERITAELPSGTKSINAEAMAFEAAEMRNRIANDRIKALEQKLLDKGLVSPAKLQIEQAVQQDLLRLNKENLELRFELESLRAELPRLKLRIQDLQNYVDILKQEKEALRSGRNLDKSYGSETSTMSTIRRFKGSARTRITITVLAVAVTLYPVAITGSNWDQIRSLRFANACKLRATSFER